MSPMAKMPGTLVSNDAVSTGISSPPFSSMPQSATGPSFMVSPKNGSSASHAMWKSEPSLVFTIALAIWPSAPSSAVTWPSTKSIFPSAVSAIILLTLSGAARNWSRRCSSVRWLASGARLSVQSSALSPPPTIKMRLPRNISILRTE